MYRKVIRQDLLLGLIFSSVSRAETLEIRGEKQTLQSPSMWLYILLSYRGHTAKPWGG